MSDNQLKVCEFIEQEIGWSVKDDAVYSCEKSLFHRVSGPFCSTCGSKAIKVQDSKWRDEVQKIIDFVRDLPDE